MRLLVVTQYFWPENFRINDLVLELVRRGHQVTVLTGLPNYPDGEFFTSFRAEPERFSRYEGATVIRVPMTPRGKGSLRLILNYISFALSATVFGLWKIRGYRFDAVLAYEPSPITVGLPAVAIRAVKRAPLIFWVQDLWPETLQAVGVVRSQAVLKAVGMLVSFIYRRCDLILAQSRSFIQAIRKYAPPQSRVLYFPNWADDFGQAPLEPAPEIPEEPGSFNVMFAGNIGEAQDFPAILAAAELLKEHANIRWLIVGDGRMAAWVADEINRRNLQGCVLMMGRYPPSRMPSFFKHADALLVSLKDEPIFSMTIPSKLQSYLAAGVPVITMLNGEGSALVRESGAGLTSPAGDYFELADAVLKLAKMPVEEREIMGQKGLMVSAREFNHDALVGRLEEWMTELIAVNVRSQVHVERP